MAHGEYILKTHDLVKLLTDVSPFVPELLPFEEQLEEISEYGVAVRYPDDFYEPSIEEAEKAYALALKIEAIVKQVLTV